MRTAFGILILIALILAIVAAVKVFTLLGMAVILICVALLAGRSLS